MIKHFSVTGEECVCGTESEMLRSFQLAADQGKLRSDKIIFN